MNNLLDKNLSILICAILVLLTLAVYGQTLGHDFINFDDPPYVTDNSHVKAGLGWSGVTWAFTTNTESNWHPLTWLSHMLDCQLYGMKPWGITSRTFCFTSQARCCCFSCFSA